MMGQAQKNRGPITSLMGKMKNYYTSPSFFLALFIFSLSYPLQLNYSSNFVHSSIQGVSFFDLTNSTHYSTAIICNKYQYYQGKKENKDKCGRCYMQSKLYKSLKLRYHQMHKLPKKEKPNYNNKYILTRGYEFVVDTQGLFAIIPCELYQIIFIVHVH